MCKRHKRHMCLICQKTSLKSGPRYVAENSSPEFRLSPSYVLIPKFGLACTAANRTDSGVSVRLRFFRTSERPALVAIHGSSVGVPGSLA